MKQNRLRTIFAVALAIISMGAWADADSRIVIAAMQNGTITASTVAEAGEQTVTLTVTPDDTYYIETSDIIVSKTSSMAQARRGAPDYAAKLKVTAVNVDDCGKGTYQFTVPDGYGAYVEATFTPCIVITPTVSITGWTYGTYDATANKPVVTGNTGKGVETFTYAKKGSDAFSATVPENADDYIIKVSIAAAGHYLAGEATADFTIAKAAGSINFAEASINKTFGEADFTNDLTIVGDGTVTYSSDKPEVAEVDAESGKVQIVGSGTAEITASVTDGTNYTYAVKTASYTLGVGTAVMEVTSEGYEGTYDGQSYGITVTAPKGATVKYGKSESSCTLDTSPTYTDAGTYTVYYEVTMANYTPVKGSAVVKIAKAAGSINFAEASINMTFGEADFTNDLTIVGDGTVTYSSDKPEVAEVDAETGMVTIVGDGTAEITATVTDGTNYTYAVKTASYSLDVAPAVMEVTATGYEGTYDGEAYGITVTAPKGATVKYGEAESSCTLDTSPTYTDAGTYTVYYEVTMENYTPVKGSAVVSIAKAAGSINYGTASVSKTYGDADFTNDLTIVGDGIVTYASDNTDVATVDAGSGKVQIVGSGTAEITATVTDGTNYTYATKTASYSLDVAPAVMEVTATGYEGTYDGQLYGITVTAPKGATVKYGEAEGSYTLDASPTYTDAGTYTVFYEATMANYTAVTGSATVRIAKAAGSISYKTASISKKFGEADFTNDLTIVGDGTVTYASDNTDVAIVDAETGMVTIVANGTANITATVEDGTNYTYTVKTASYILGVGTAVMEVTSEGYEGIYDGLAYGITVTAPKGATVKYGEAEGSCTLDTSPTYTDAGTYTVYYEVTMENYTPVKGSAVVSIAKAAGSIQYGTASVSKTYGDADFTNDLTIVGDGIVNYASDNLDVATVDAETGMVTIVGNGTATITATVVDGTNYAYAVKTANYAITVSPKDVKNIMVVVIDNQTYTGSELKPAVTVKDGEVILTENVDYTVTYADNVIVGTATVTITGIGNYSGTVSVTFAILADKANLEAAIEAATEYYDSIKDDYSSIADLLKEAIDVAQDILDQIDATQEDTDAAQDDLDAAVQSAINSIKIATAIDAVRTAEADNDVWYDMNGRKRQGQPTKKGLIIKNGKKMIVR